MSEQNVNGFFELVPLLNEFSILILTLVIAIQYMGNFTPPDSSDLCYILLEHVSAWKLLMLIGSLQKISKSLFLAYFGNSLLYLAMIASKFIFYKKLLNDKLFIVFDIILLNLSILILGYHVIMIILSKQNSYKHRSDDSEKPYATSYFLINMINLIFIVVLIFSEIWAPYFLNFVFARLFETQNTKNYILSFFLGLIAFIVYLTMYVIASKIILKYTFILNYISTLIGGLTVIAIRLLIIINKNEFLKFNRIENQKGLCFFDLLTLFITLGIYASVYIMAYIDEHVPFTIQYSWNKSELMKIS